MNKHKALLILDSISKDMYGEWKIPHWYKRCEREVTLSNGEKATLAVDDEVYEFIAYVKKLIENVEEE